MNRHLQARKPAFAFALAQSESVVFARPVQAHGCEHHLCLLTYAG